MEQQDEYSLENLQNRITHFIEMNPPCRVAMAISGGGGFFLSMMAATPGASKILLEGTITRDLDPDTFKYDSPEAAKYASEAALEKALRLTAAGDTLFGHFSVENMTGAIGLACVSALQSNDLNDASRACITAMGPNGSVEVQTTLSRTAGRTRFDEDIFVSHCILTCLEHALEDAELEKEKVITKETAHGDQIQVLLPPSRPHNTEEILRHATDRILSGKEKSVAILPCTQTGGYKALPITVLPPHSIVIPGSFNPPHDGHVQLAKSSLDATDCEVAWFEISITNADKASLQPDDVVQRLLGFLKLNDMPDHWGIIITNAPLFVQKVDLLNPLQVSRSFEVDPLPLHFVIGTDTLVRIIDPKYYDNSEDKMLQALYDMQCRFVVGGRLEQSKTKKDDDQPVFISAEPVIEGLPEDLRDKFTPLKDFRVDVSSTELRRRLQQQKEAESSK